MPDRDAMIEAGAEAVYEAMPVVLKDLVSRAEAEAAIGVPHGVGVPDRWLAAAVLDVVRPLILREAAEKMRERDEFAALDCGCYSHAADLLERLADGNTTTDNVGSQGSDPTLICALRAGRPEHTPESEPVLIETVGAAVVFALDDGERLEFDRVELLSALGLAIAGDMGRLRAA